MWTPVPKIRSGSPLPADWRMVGWTLRCRVRYADGGATWELVPDRPIERDGHVARFLAVFETDDEAPPLSRASARLGLHDWEEVR